MIKVEVKKKQKKYERNIGNFGEKEAKKDFGELKMKQCRKKIKGINGNVKKKEKERKIKRKRRPREMKEK